MKGGTHGAKGAPAWRDRLKEAHDHDPYRDRGKLADPTVCTACGACYHEGRWTWRPAPADSAQTVCPACRRIRDGYPAGQVTLEGDFWRAHAEEIRGLVGHVEEREKQQHPLNRLVEISEDAGALVLTTTDAHLAHAIAKAIHHAYQGELDCQWAEGQTLLRAVWTR